MATLRCSGLILGLLFLCIVGAKAGDYCYSEEGFSLSLRYCPYGCCGHSYNQYCCTTSSVGLIIGCVFAGVGGLSIVIAVVCCCIKEQGQRGRVLQRSGATNVAVVQSQSDTAYTQPGPFGMGMGYPTMPPHAQQPYQHPPYTAKVDGPVPPPYAYSDPAYPPAAGGFVQGPSPPQAAAVVASKH